MKKILSLVLVSALGGALTLGAYKLFLDDNQKLVVTTTESKPAFVQTRATGVYNADENPNVTIAAESSINTVVHVKNLALNKGGMSVEDFFFGRRSQQPQLG